MNSKIDSKIDSKEFFESWMKILGFVEWMFDSVIPPTIWTVRFRSENDLEFPWVLTFSELEWTFRIVGYGFKMTGYGFEDLLETFVKNLEENIKTSDFTFYMENKKTKEKRMICENPRSLEEMLIQSELNFK